MERQAFFKYLTYIMRLIDECSEEVISNDVNIPPKVLNAVNNDKELHAEVLILMNMLDTSYLIEKKLSYETINTPKIQLSFDERLKLLQQYYQKEYIPYLKSHSLGNKLIDCDNKNLIHS